jgi:hypothetical protein
MPIQRTLVLADIPWLRLSARRVGASNVPPAIAAKLLAAGLVERGLEADCLKITNRGQLALTLLG